MPMDFGPILFVLLICRGARPEGNPLRIIIYQSYAAPPELQEITHLETSML